MIVVRIIGGLGNQLFQYALGRRLALERDVPLRLDVSGFASYGLHEYSLCHYRIEETFATADDLAALLPGAGAAGRLARLRDRILPMASRRVVIERDRRFVEAVLGIRAPVYLDGYWQSERYFAPIAAQLRAEFGLHEPPSPEDAAVESLIRGSACSVGVHFRRGNYAADAGTRAHHGIAEPEYYARALAALRERVGDFRVFVFSDDVAWVREHGGLDDQDVVYVDHNQGFDGQAYVKDRNYQDLRLLSLCDHQVIANSTFSWWAAWLNDNDDKIVIAPQGWFADGSDSSDIVPASWTRL